MAESARQTFEKRLSALRVDRETWIPHYRDISDHLLPRRGRFLQGTGKINKGEVINQKIIDSSAGFALRTLSAGLMGGLTSPSRPWFQLSTKDISLREFGPVKVWLQEVQQRMLQVFSGSNIYKTLPAAYEELGSYGTTSLIVLEDPETIMRSMLFPTGSYFLANSPQGKVDTVYREFSMTVDQMVRMFGKEHCSKSVQNAYDQSATEKWRELVHLIEPNDERVQGALDFRGKRFRSVWFEKGESTPAFLRQGGFDTFPGMSPRWWLNGEDVYGRSPAMDALGDIKQLQHQQKRKAQAIDKIVQPPMNVPVGMKQANLMPGGVNAIPNGQQGASPAFQINPQFLAIRDDIAEVQRRISRAFYEDLFLMLANTDRREITAREVEEKHEEKLLQLGPVLERIEDELLDPLIDRTFELMLRQPGLVPEPPEELQGTELKVEYISILAQAQRSVGTASLDRLAQFAAGAAQLSPESLDKVDFDQAMDEYGAMLGVPPSVIRSDEAVDEIRQARARAEQAQRMLEQASQAAAAAKDLSQVDLGDGENAAQRITNRATQPGGIAGPA